VPKAPTVILLHEMEGLTSKTVALANRFVEAGFSVGMPVLLPPPRFGAVARNMVRLCVSAEFRALARRSDRPLTCWLRDLAAREFKTTRTGVGIVGMCMTGNFALAAAAAPGVQAAVASQPAVPPTYLNYTTDLGMSSSTFDTLAGRAEDEGLCFRILRFQSDWISRRARTQFIRNSLPQRTGGSRRAGASSSACSGERPAPGS
jgi:hypothetical protein